MTEERPKLQIGLKPEIFREYYYLKAELQTFCQEHGLSKSGSKAELNERIEYFLRTGEQLARPMKEKRSVRTEELTLESLIEENIIFSEVHRAFFKENLEILLLLKLLFKNG